MADIFSLPQGQLIKASGKVYPGAKAYFYDPGAGLAQRTVYKDADETEAWTQPITADSAGRLPAIYVPTGSFRVIVTSFDGGVTIIDQDNVTGALDLSAFEAQTFALPITPIGTKLVDDNMVAADLAKFFLFNPTSANINYSLLSAATVQNGKGVRIKHTGTANDIILHADGSETVGGSPTYTYSRQGGTFDVISNEANWIISDAILNENEVTLANLAGGTEGGSFEIDEDGNPIILAPGADKEVLASNGPGEAKSMDRLHRLFDTFDFGLLQDNHAYAAQNHNLGDYPVWFAYLQLTATYLGYSSGRRFLIGSPWDSAEASRGISITASTTQFDVRTGSAIDASRLLNFSNGGGSIANDLTKFRIIVMAA